MFKKYFTAGLLLWIPLAITLWLIEKIVRWSDIVVHLLPPEYRPENLFGFSIPGLGIVLGIALIFVTGVLVANFLGQRIVALWEALLDRIPLVRSIYQGIKQITSTVLSNQDQSFKEVVLVEFPQPGQWTYGFVVGNPGEGVKSELGTEDLVTVYVPTAPNPTSGFVVMMTRSRVRKTAVPVEEALKYHLSLGVMTPGASGKRS